MAGAGYRNWTVGDIPTATQFDTFLQEQTVMTFASTAARDTALSVVKAEGMHAYSSDINTLHYYNGSSWVVVHEPPQSWNETSILQGSAVACATSVGWFQRSNGAWRGQLAIVVSGTGTTGNEVVVPTPFALTNANNLGGSWAFKDVSTGLSYVGSLLPFATTSFTLLGSIGSSATLLGVVPNIPIQPSDELRVTVTGTY